MTRKIFYSVVFCLLCAVIFCGNVCAQNGKEGLKAVSRIVKNDVSVKPVPVAKNDESLMADDILVSNESPVPADVVEKRNSAKAAEDFLDKDALDVKDEFAGALDQRMALDLRDMDIVETLKFLAMKGGINIIVSKDVSGRVSLFLKDTTIGSALDIILLANNLAYEKRGAILYVMTEDEYRRQHGENFKDARLIKTAQIRYAKPESVFKAIDLLKSEIGKVVVDEESGVVIMADTAEKIKEMQNAIACLDVPMQTKTFVLQYSRVKDVEPILAARLNDKKTGTVAIDEKNNQLIITALPERMQEAQRLIRDLDKKTKQVLLEAKILKVVLSDDFDMGIDWDKVWSQLSMNGLNFAGDFAFPSTISNYFKMGVGNDEATGHSYSAVIKILQEFGETRNLSSPSIAVIDGEEAKILVGRTEAYVTTTIATGSTTSSTAAQVTFIDIGVQLTVKPIINDNGYVTMKIKPEISNVDGSLTYKIAADVDNTVPLVARTTAETTVIVKNNTTIIIGGLRKDEKIKTVSKLPFLGDIPFFGALFRKSSDELEKTEVVVLITPHIMMEDVDAEDNRIQAKGLVSYDRAVKIPEKLGVETKHGQVALKTEQDVSLRLKDNKPDAMKMAAMQPKDLKL